MTAARIPCPATFLRRGTHLTVTCVLDHEHDGPHELAPTPLHTGRGWTS